MYGDGVFREVQFSHSGVSDFLLPHGLQHAKIDFSVYHQLPDLTQTHVHRDSNAEVMKLNEVIRES